MTTPNTTERTAKDILSDMNNLRHELHRVAFKDKPSVEEVRAAKKAAKAAKYKTRNGLSVHALRLAGNQVRVTHMRKVFVPGIPKELVAPTYLRDHVEFRAKGGSTFIEVVDSEGNIHPVLSVCHDHDHFDFKMGVKIALEQIDDESAALLLEGKAVTPLTEQDLQAQLEALAAPRQ